MKKFARYVAPLATATLPAFAMAQGLLDTGESIIDLLNLGIRILLVLATLMFIWGLISYLIAGPDEGKAATARSYMLWGIVSLAVIIAMWGLARLLLDTFNIDAGSVPENVGQDAL